MTINTELSIVIIARNEAKNIARAIESVLRATEVWPQTEILLVDSASTDETVEIAKRYPINIVRLPSTWFLSVPAGRLIGMHYTRGDLVLHMDGDMELDPEWVNRSVSFALEHPQVGAVGGYWRNVYLQDKKIVGEEDDFRDPQGRVLAVEYVGGAALYRRCAIEAMGGFHPFIRGEEGVYLCMGIRHAGYRVIRLPYLMSRHYCVPPQSLAYSLRRLRLDMWLGYGQVPRYYWGTELFWTYLKERGSAFMVFIAGMFVSIAALLLSIFFKNILFFGSWLLIVIGLMVIFTIKKRSLSKALASLIARAGITYSAVRGFLMTPRSPSEYPTDAEIVQVCFHRGAFSKQEF
jgi:glycosyltransferase involved in cell wall biosynthesis